MAGVAAETQLRAAAMPDFAIIGTGCAVLAEQGGQGGSLRG